MTDETIDKLFSLSEDAYGSDYKDKLFEQYKLFLQMIDSLTHRRAITNSFFLSINTGILAAFGLVSQLGIGSSEFNIIWVLGGSIAGILFSCSWFLIVKSYKQLSTIKWKIILKIEKKLPLLIHDTEWKLLGEGNDWKKYLKLTGVEQIIPFIFIAIYLLMALLIIGNFDPLF